MTKKDKDKKTYSNSTLTTLAPKVRLIIMSFFVYICILVPFHSYDKMGGNKMTIEFD